MGIVSIDYERKVSWAVAQAEAGEGYQDDKLVAEGGSGPRDMSRAEIARLPGFVGHAMCAMGIVAAATRRTIFGPPIVRVLDVGGAAGGHFGIAQTTFGDTVEFHWTVMETPLYVKYGKQFQTPRLNFVSEASELADKEFDLVYLSGVLPYVPDQAAVLSEDVLRRAPYVFISRTDMEEDESVFLQRVVYDNGEVRYPGRITGRRWLWEQMQSLGYKLMTSWEFEQYGPDRKLFQAPSMLWRRTEALRRSRRRLFPAPPPSRADGATPRIELAVDYRRLSDVEARRLLNAAAPVRETISALDRWLAQSREHDRYAYELAPANRRSLAAMIAAAVGKEIAEIEGYLAEIERDGVLAQAVSSRGCAFLGRRLGWYAVARALKPRIVVETRIAEGVGATVLAAALLRNVEEGFSSQYYGIDPNGNAGRLLQAPYTSVVHRLPGDPIDGLNAFGDRIDLFVHNGAAPGQVEAAQAESQEYAAIELKLSDAALVLADAAYESEELLAFAARTGRDFLSFRETPLDHWHPGLCLGLAFRRR